MSYASVILADNPDGAWPLDESSGTVAIDISASPHNGIYSGSGTFTLGVAGPISGHTAVQLNGKVGKCNVVSTYAT